ncbi:unnamed protein product [Dovyalis caffra]|uniref:Transposase n=1 Tax=Dovyalis caffra TaxID=77055 RepID=A0AAV1SDB7_9ROSI|nr:unnamed protein product [Dovyalis caffra]
MLELRGMLNQLQQEVLIQLEIRVEALKEILEGDQNPLDNPEGINNDSNGSNNVLINKLEVECKENVEAAQQKKIVDLGYVDPFDYKLAIITKADLFKDYMDETHIDEASLRFAIHYSTSQWKRNELPIDVSYAKFYSRGLKLISRIVIHLKRRKKGGWRVFIGHPCD